MLAKKGEKAVFQTTGNDEKACITVLINANAAGELAPPMVVFKYERVPPGIIRQFPGEWGLGKSESGWMKREKFYEYVTNVFQLWLRAQNIEIPILLFIDGHTFHLSVYLSDYCYDNQIENSGLISKFDPPAPTIRCRCLSPFNDRMEEVRQRVAF